MRSSLPAFNFRQQRVPPGTRLVPEAESKFVYRKVYSEAFLYSLVFSNSALMVSLAFKERDLIHDVNPVIPINSMQTEEILIMTLN